MGDTQPAAVRDGLTILEWAQGLLGLVVVASGIGKLRGHQRHVEQFEQWGYPQWVRVTTGGTETLGGVGLLAGLRSPVAALFGGPLVVGTMVGAVYTHLLRVDDPPSEAAMPGVFLMIAALVTGRQLRHRAESDRGATDD